ncbi:hypothetical protein V6N11_003090 [Hibiscus sabdariffa]|uniref:Uncharacterized protein n=1 Tax=Hibiscus sabdariffa TaxID=183260 RepID=A0ABR2SCV9_9ROSI
MAHRRSLALCLILVLYSVSRSECRLLNPNTEGQNPTVSSRMLFLATSSGRVMYRFSTEIRDDLTKNKNLYDSKLSRSESRLPNPYINGMEATRSFRAFSVAAGSDGRPLGPYTEGRNLIMSIRALAAREALKIGRTENEINNLYESKRVSPGGPDPQHHSIHH